MRTLQRNGSSKWLAIALVLGLQSVLAQFLPPAPQDFLENRRRVDGALHVCLNLASSLVEFDRAVAQAIGDALLVPVVFHELFTAYPPTSPYEFSINLSEADLYVGIMNNCDAMMGAWLHQDAVPSWLTVTQPYYSTRVVFATTAYDHADPRRLPFGAAVGSRIAGSGDFQFRSFVTERSPGTIRRIPYPSNESLITRLLDGTLDGILIWEPAIYAATGGDPAAAGVMTAPLPFQSTELNFGLAVPLAASFLRSTLDAAIAALQVDGTIVGLVQRYDLPTK